MIKAVPLSYEFLHDTEVMPTEGTPTDWIAPAVFDIPTKVYVSTGDRGDVVLRFVYPDHEEAGPEAPLGGNTDIVTMAGRHSGKLIAARFPAGHLPGVADQLTTLAGRQSRKYLALNYRLLSNILRKKQAELQPA